MAENIKNLSLVVDMRATFALISFEMQETRVIPHLDECNAQFKGFVRSTSCFFRNRHMPNHVGLEINFGHSPSLTLNFLQTTSLLGHDWCNANQCLHLANTSFTSVKAVHKAVLQCPVFFYIHPRKYSFRTQQYAILI